MIFFPRKRRLRKNIEDDDDDDQMTAQKKGPSELVFGENLMMSEVKEEPKKTKPNNQKKRATKSLKVEKPEEISDNLSNIEKIIDKANIFEEKKQIEFEDFEEQTPIWARSGHSKDKSLRPHGTEDADPTTLYIPE
jgi:DNA mismatch repair protein MSH6